MSLSELIKPDAVLPALRVNGKKQALQEMSERAAEVSGLPSREIFDALLQRENRIEGGGGGSSGRKAKSEKPASMSDRRESQRARMAGHDEIRMGRPLKGDERRENFCTSIDPMTRRVLRDNAIAVADVLDEIADLPEVRAFDGVGAQGESYGD